MQTGHSQLRRYKAKKQMVISEESGTEAVKPKSQLLEFWLVREYCDRGSLLVSILSTRCLNRHVHLLLFEGHRIASIVAMTWAKKAKGSSSR